MLRSRLDHWLTRAAAELDVPGLRFIDTASGKVRVLDSGTSAGSCVVMVPDGPNLIEHHAEVSRLLTHKGYRVVCFDMPGFGFSRPSASHMHSLDQGAEVIRTVLDALSIERATLAFSCANGFYALKLAQASPERIASLFLSQTPSLPAMHAWTRRTVPWLLRVPVMGQLVGWLFRAKMTSAWYRISLPKGNDGKALRPLAASALAAGGCFCLAGVVQGLTRESAASLQGVSAPCTVVWGSADRSHRLTSALSMRECVPHAQVVLFEDCGHFPDLEQPQRYVRLLTEHLTDLAFRRKVAATAS